MTENTINNTDTRITEAQLITLCGNICARQPSYSQLMEMLRPHFIQVPIIRKKWWEFWK